jgi:hypothetical protein
MTRLSNQPFLAVAGGVFAVVVSGAASAQVSASPSGSASGLTETVATQLISSTSLQQMLTISNAIGFRMGAFQLRPPGIAGSGQVFGMAAGSSAERWNAWGSLAANNNEYRNLGLDVTTTVVGGDYLAAPTLAVGVSAAYDRSTGSLFNTTFTGYTVAPYLGWQINKDWVLDATMGWGEGDASFGAATVKPDRFFYGTNLSYTTWSGNWQFSGKGSYLYGEEKYNTTLVNAKNKIDEVRLGGQAAYWMNGIMPYISAAYISDNQRSVTTGSDDLGKSAWLWSVGANFISLKNNLTGGIAYSSESGRSNSKRDSVMLNINYRF